MFSCIVSCEGWIDFHLFTTLYPRYMDISINTAVLAYIDAGDQHLWIQRKKAPNKGKHVFVGGRIQKGESLEEAIRREVLEETGYSVENLKLVGQLYECSLSYNWLSFIFHVRCDFFEPIACSEGDLIWLPKSQLPSPGLPTTPYVLEALNKGENFMLQAQLSAERKLLKLSSLY